MKQEIIARILNLASLLLVSVAIVVALARFSANPTQIPPDATADNLQDAKATLYFVLATDCGYCDASAEYYRALLASRMSNEFHAVAVFQEPVNLSKEYLRTHGLVFDSVQQRDFKEIGVFGTPAMALLNADGQVVKRWHGKLSIASQEHIGKLVKVDRLLPASMYAESLRSREIRGLAQVQLKKPEEIRELRATGRIVLLDVRPRMLFEREHIPGSTNIPLADISTDSLKELSRSSPVYIVCNYSLACEQDEAEAGRSSICFLAGSLLISNGFQEVSVLSASMKQLRALGMLSNSSNNPTVTKASAKT